MKLRRLLAITCLQLAFLGGPFVSAYVDLAGGLLVFVAFVGLAFLAAFYRRRMRPTEAEIHRAMARNITIGDPL